MPVVVEVHVDVFFVVTSLMGGVALLGYAMALMSGALRDAFGAGLKEGIRTACATRGSAFMTGAVSTAILTSSTATSALVLQFVAGGDMTFEQSLGVLLGINVGSTLNAHLLSVHMQRYGMLLVAAGYLASLLHRLPRVRHVGVATLGLGLLFTSIGVMAAGIAPLKHSATFLAALTYLHTPATAAVVAALAAVVLQSSNTVIAIAILLAHQGFLPLESAVYLVYGANVGTCVTSLALAVGQPRDAMRVAVVYLLFKAVGVAVLMPCTPVLMALLGAMSTAAQAHAEEAALAAALADGSLASNGIGALEGIREAARRALLPTQVATAHTLVNVAIAAIFMPLLPVLAPLLSRLTGGVTAAPPRAVARPPPPPPSGGTVYAGSIDDADHPFFPPPPPPPPLWYAAGEAGMGGSGGATRRVVR